MKLINLLAAVASPLALSACAIVSEEGDEAYLRGLCSAADSYAAAIADAPDTETIAAATDAYRDEVAGLQPPDDIVEYHTGLVDYLGRLAESPAEPQGDPPEIPDAQETRLTGLAETIDECRDAGYFEQPG